MVSYGGPLEKGASIRDGLISRIAVELPGVKLINQPQKTAVEGALLLAKQFT